VVPPIIAKYLFRPASTNVQDLDMPHVGGSRETRDPYTLQTLARALREGINPNGRELSLLMPRYALDDATMAALGAYLGTLTAGAVPGVSDDTLHFATIIAADADPVQRQAMLDVMQRFFSDKNAFIRGGSRKMQAGREIEYRVTRRWQLHVWELSGPPETWDAQLRAKLAAEPVFAVVSGLAGRNWAPVHRFCQVSRLPCLFPNVDRPDVDEHDFYSIYFSRGVFLEADLLASRLAAQRGDDDVVQLYRAGDIGESAAAAVQRSLQAAGRRVRSMALPPTGAPAQIAEAVRGITAPSTLLLWLRPADLAALPAPPTGLRATLLSGLMGDFEHAPLPAAWRPQALIAYPMELPDARKVRLTFPLTWLRINKIPVIAERVQVDTYVACGVLAETLNDMLDAFVRDYLIERVETMLSHRLSNGYYPRLSLAPGQRFASKGGYLVRFAEAQGSRIVAEGEWTVP
jgi:hypothetical protein